MAERVRLVIDCDCGVDDATAIMMALGAANVDMVAVTCVTGNTAVDKVAINVLRVLRKCDRLNIPVHVGSSSYILGKPFNAEYHHGSDGLGDIPDPEGLPSKDLLQSEHAVLALIRLARENPKQITLVALGPLTNVALAIRLDPDFTSNLKDLVIMGGNIQAKGTGFSTAEFNFGSDPEAAHIVLEDTECPTTLVPLETCIEHGVSFEWFDTLSKKETARARFLYAINDKSVLRCRNEPRLAKYMVADGCAIVVAARRDAVRDTKRSVCKVELEGKMTRGQVVADKLNTPWVPTLSGVQIEIVTKFDMKSFYDMLNDATA